MKKFVKSFVFLSALTLLASCGQGKTSSSSKPSSSTPSTSTPSSSTPVDSTSSSTPTTDSGFRMESEYVDLTGITGSGISGSASGVNMIQSNRNASNGYYVGFSHRLGFALTYTFNASAADDSAKISLGLGNELGVGMEETNTSLTVSVNGSNLSYKKFTIKVEGFASYDLSATASLVAGENTIVVTVAGENTYCNGGTGGPLFDYVDVKSASTLTWTPKTSNLPDDE
ncbi:MAG: hypothetical protein PUA93_00090 [Eubacteriales bacterium]|nr:hypothetical protein [Eubacteriales bacterium]